MERKIVQHGPATLMVSLPAKWAREKGLKKGDTLEITQKENGLLMNLDKTKHKDETSLDLSSLEESSIRTLLTNAYRLGYDKINIHFTDKDALKTIKELSEKNLLGFEVTSKSKKGCVIENITEPSLEQFDNIFSKVFSNIEDLFIIGENLLNGKKDDYEDIDRKIQQFDNFCKRVLVKNSLFENNFLQWSFHSSLIHGTRELYHLFEYLSKKKIKTSNYELLLLEKCKKMFGMIREAYDKEDIKILERVHEEEKEISYNKGYEALNKSTNPIVIHHLITATKHLYLANSPLMGILLTRQIPSD
jgi:phosphate uptake regulator